MDGGAKLNRHKRQLHVLGGQAQRRDILELGPPNKHLVVENFTGQFFMTMNRSGDPELLPSLLVVHR